MSHDPLLDSPHDDEQDYLEAVNDDAGHTRPSSRADTLRARRRVEALLEERRLRRAIEDAWDLEEEE